MSQQKYLIKILCIHSEQLNSTEYVHLCLFQYEDLKQNNRCRNLVKENKNKIRDLFKH